MRLLEVRMKVKAFSANRMYYRGKNKTREYLEYQNDIRDELTGVEWPFKDNPVSFFVEVGLSNKRADLDNVLKPFLDTLQKVYEEFNDCRVYYIEAVKRIVPKGEEYIHFSVDLHSSTHIQRKNKDENKLQQVSE